MDWATDLLVHMRKNNISRIEASQEAENEWTAHVKDTYKYSLLGNSQSWFTGYNSNVAGHDKLRYMIYNGGAPRFRQRLQQVAADGYAGFDLS